jgi:diguanylate cyclase (GGDEF)-like protein
MVKKVRTLLPSPGAIAAALVQLRDRVRARIARIGGPPSEPQGGSLAPPEVEHGATRVLAHLGLARFTALLTIVSAILSTVVAWLFDHLVDLPSHMLVFIALVVPFLVTLPLSYLTAVSLWDLRQARARSRALAEAAERERGYLHSAVNNMPIGLVLFNASKRLIVCNDQYRNMYGLPVEVTTRGTHLREMLEHRLKTGSFEGADREEYIERILKLVERKDTDLRVVELGDGRTISIIHHPIAAGGWVGTHEDVTERQKLQALLEEQNQALKGKERQLETRNMHLDAALNNIVQGLAMFDREYRLVLCNDRYRQIYHFPADLAKPGTPLQELIEYRVRDGLQSDRSAAEIADLMLRHRDDAKFKQFHSQLSDGRCIAITAQPMPDGGTVTTHQDITEQRRSEAKIAHMALHDPLTGLPNRAFLNEQLGHALPRAKRGEILAVHLLDLDRFKSVNDTLGHHAGDKLLNLVAERLQFVARETDTVARMGGDEFAIVQVGIAQPSDATSLALRVIAEVSKPYDIDDHQVIIGTSVGIAVGPEDGLEADVLLRKADLALYRAKADGRGTFRFFEHQMDAQMQSRRALECDLRRALVRQEFELHYQPMVDLERNDIKGFEALLRWRHPHKGLIAPGEFIGLAEEIGVIVPLGEWVIRQACAAAATWPDDLEVAVNLSPLQFATPGLAQIVASALAASGLQPARLELEITESALLHNSEDTLDTLYQLRTLGVRIAMDDFGTGYSSLSYLQSFPFDKIKIDRSFIKDVSDGVGSLNIVRAVAAMARGLGMKTTAEGVETPEQLEIVRAEGCTEMQGYLFSKPLAAGELERLYLADRRPGKARASSAA